MADNYLERRMEEHRASRMVPRLTNKPAPLKSGRVIVEYPPQRILVTGGDSPVGQAVIKGFIAMKCPVSFTVSDSTNGATIAQSTGARYIPGTLETAIDWHFKHSDPIKVIIDTQENTLSVLEDSTFTLPFHPAAIESGPEAIASWCIFASHHANRWLFIQG